MNDQFIEYCFDSIEYFYAELDEVLETHYNTEEEVLFVVDKYIKLVIRYQPEFIHGMNELSHISHQLLDSYLFLNNTTAILSHITYTYAIIPTLRDVQLAIPYSIIYFAGIEDRRWLLFILSEVSEQNEDILFMKILHELKTYTGGYLLMSISFKVAFEIGKAATMSKKDLKSITTETLRFFFDLIESTSEDWEESFNYDIITFVLMLNNQYVITQTDNRVIVTIQQRKDYLVAFPQNMLFMLNREEDTYKQTLILTLLHLVFTTDDLCDMFYTNDLYVLVDIITRSIERLDSDNDSNELLNDYLRVLQNLLVNTSLKNTNYKSHYIYKTLCSVVTPYLNRSVRKSTQTLVKTILETWWKNIHDKPIAPILGVHVKHAIIESRKAGETGIIVSNSSSAVSSDNEK